MTGMVCKRCGLPLIRDWAGWMHRPGFQGRPHKIVAVPARGNASTEEVTTRDVAGQT